MGKPLTPYNFLQPSVEFEQLCADIFRDKGLIVEKNVKVGNRDQEVDLIVTNDNGKEFAAEVKFYRTRKPSKNMLVTAAVRLKTAAKSLDTNVDNLLLIIGMPIENKMKEEIKKEYDVLVIDSNNLLALTGSNESFKIRLQNLMYDVPSNMLVEYQPEKIDLEEIFNYSVDTSLTKIPKSITKSELLRSELKSIKSGKKAFAQYEKKCKEILEYVFKENLDGWNKQLRTEDGLNRYDLVCRVKRGNEFWEFLIDDFNSRYIIFEFKNYKKKVKQTQVYTTEKYLFQKALRNVCFMISREGLDDNAIIATKGILRETGKLIINMNNSDLEELLILKGNGGEPSDHLFGLVDKLLLELSK
ncbi:restriction endonuclease [Bacillus albus]|uniref:restriction endonuclease n=1 Tax=Bacillus albus TaxID=2026189 RepID=UPI003014DEC3